MKQYWQKLVLQIDALSLRERVIVFGMAALIMVVLVNMAVLDPQAAKQRQFSRQLYQNQTSLTQIQAEITQKSRAQAIDPDAESRTQLLVLKQKSEQVNAALKDMQKGVVSPDKMSEVLRSILRQDGKLSLVSLRTLPVAGLNDPLFVESEKKLGTRAVTSPNEPKSPSAEATKTDVVYRHGVEITVQGSYLDILSYLATLETLPWQLYWGNARLTVDEYPKSRLILTLYTMSLDKKWLNI